MKKLVSLMLVIAMLSMIFVGCSKEEDTKVVTTDAMESTEATTEAAVEEGIDTTENVKLKMYFLGGAPEDMDMVWAEINKKLTEKINAEIEPVILGWGDWADRYPLLFASGEEWDMIYTANWAFYSQQASKGGFLELTPEMLNKYAPMTVATLPTAAFESTTVNDKNYMIPANSKWAIHEFVTIRGDLREKYGLPEVKTLADLEVYMDKVLENEEGMIPLADMGMNSDNTLRAMLLLPQSTFSVVDNVGQLAYNYADSSTFTTTPAYELPGYLDYMKKMVDWRNKGYWSRSALTTEDTAGQNFLNGLGAAKFSNVSDAQTVYATWKTEHPEWKLEVVDLTEGKPLPANGFLGNGSAINAASANPERALMALELLGYDSEINYLIMQGMPGVHTNNVGTETARKIETVNPTYGGSYSQWCFDNFDTLPIDSFVGYEALRTKILVDQIAYHPALGLTFNPDNVKTEIAATSQVIAQYKPIIQLGFNDDPEATLAAYIQALKDAGIEKLDAEIQAQGQAQFDAVTK
jgi:putative aldouronate transport system substrate-binding protein